MMPGGFKNMNSDQIIQCILCVMLKLEKSVEGIVEDQIVDGVTDKASSQNAVYDALESINTNFSRFKIKVEDSFDYTAAQNLVGENQIIAIPADGKASIVLVNNGLESLDGIDYTNITGNALAEIPHPGKPYFIFNNTDNSITLNHGIGTASATYKPFEFYNGEDMVLPPGGMAEFKLNDTTNTLDKVPGGATVINDLITGGTSDALSAEMGVFLKSLIDNIFQPDTLISGVPPTRSVNTFTYPANGYVALINKTVRTNPAQFITTINVAATDYKRVDLIWFKSDNTLVKTVGTESLTVAQRPDIPVGQVGVPVSFINVFGNVISDPTPITQEVSFQDIFGVERFKGDFVRFDGVSFDPLTNLISINPLVPLSAYLDIVNGNDTTAALTNSNKPFKTIEKLISSLPASTGETYTIYITGGTIPILRRMPGRNLRFIAYTNTILDFTNCMENDGVTSAIRCLTDVGYIGTWTFENQNISIRCTSSATEKIFSWAAGNLDTTVAVLGRLFDLRWFSPLSTTTAVFSCNTGSDLQIMNVYDFTSTLGTLLSVRGRITVTNLYKSSGTPIFLFATDATITNIIKTNETLHNFNAVANGGTVNLLKLGTINKKGSFIITVSRVEFQNSVLTDIDVNLVAAEISGRITSTTGIIRCEPFTGMPKFINYSGKIDYVIIWQTSKVYFENCIINTPGTLLYRQNAGGAQNSTIEQCVDFRGSNVIVQANTAVNLFGQGSAGLPIAIKIEGKVDTNANTYGKNTSYVQATATFKEELKKIVIRSKYDLINKVLDTTLTYILDANITLLAGEFIRVPMGLTFGGTGVRSSKVSKNVSGESIFIIETGGSGDLFMEKITIDSGAGSVFNITDATATTHAVELNDVNFENCSSLGKISGYRQFTGTTCGIYNCLDGLTLEGAWSGFKLTNTNVTGFGAAGILFKKGASTTFSGRFFIDLNESITTGAVLCDFAPTNIINDKSFHVVNGFTKIGGILDPASTSLMFPNMPINSIKAYFVNNVGLINTDIDPYGISTVNMPVYANDAAAATGGLAVGRTYIETATGYFKKRLI